MRFYPPVIFRIWDFLIGTFNFTQSKHLQLKARWEYLYEIFISMDTIELEKTRIKSDKVSHEKNEGLSYRKMFVSGIGESDSHA